MDFAPLLAALAAFVAAGAFLVRASTPAIVAWLTEGAAARTAERRELADSRAALDAAERRIQILEMRLLLSGAESTPP